jgi:hypothetical protein
VFGEWEIWQASNAPALTYTLTFNEPDVPNTGNTFQKIVVQGTFAESADSFDLLLVDATYQANFNGRTVWTWDSGDLLDHTMQDGFDYNWTWFRLTG